MIGAFPSGEGWVTLQLAADHDEHRPRLLELLGACPGDADAQLARMTICESAEDALAHAAARLNRGWAAHAMADEPGDALDAAAALDAPASTPTVTVTDTALRTRAGARGGRARRGRHARAVLPVSQPDRRPPRIGAARQEGAEPS